MSHAPPVEEHHIEFISEVLMQNKIPSRTCTEDRTLFVWDRHLIGRIVEIGRLKWSMSAWDVKHDCLQVIICYIMAYYVSFCHNMYAFVILCIVLLYYV